MAPGGIKPRPPKRVHAEFPTNARVTRSNKRLLLDADASPRSEAVSDPKHQTPTAIHKPTVSVPETEETVPNFDNHAYGVEDGDRAHSDDDYWMTNGSDLIARHDDGNQMDFDAGGSVEPCQQTQTEPENDTRGPRSYEETRERGVNIGKGLERISRRRGGKLPLVIPEGRIRPEAPLLAAKFATECNVTVRGHVPVFKRWKDYKDPDGNVRQGIFQNFVGKVGNKFEMDIQAVPVRKACTQMLKGAIRQQRYRLKQKYFDPFPLNLVTKTSPVRSMTDEQWNELVESWKDPKKMEICGINKNNRAQVKFHQTTGSGSYPVHLDTLGDKYKEKEPTALDLFKECHYSSKKKGYTDTVQAAIDEMEKNASQHTEDGQQSNSATKAVAEVLSKHTKKPMFLKHVGVQHVQERSSRSDREAELAAEKKESAELWGLVETLSNRLKESEEARIRQEEARTKQEEENRKKQAEMETKLDFLLSQIHPR